MQESRLHFTYPITLVEVEDEHCVSLQDKVSNSLLKSRERGRDRQSVVQTHTQTMTHRLGLHGLEPILFSFFLKVLELGRVDPIL